MSTRFTTGAMFAILGDFVVVISQAFSPSVVGWVARSRVVVANLPVGHAVLEDAHA